MEITSEQVEELKKQVINQINSTFPEDKKEDAIEQLNLMDEKEFIEFLKKNKLIKSSEKEQGEGENPFRLIIKGEIPHYKIDENKDSLAILEINPISKAHTIIIPKKQVKEMEKIPSSIFTLAKKVSKRITSEFNPKEVLISSSKVLGEVILNILPVYNAENMTSQRNPASKDELEELKKILEKKYKKSKPKVMRPRKEKKSESKINQIKETKLWLPKRIP